MPSFVRVPSGEVISNTTVAVAGDHLRVGLDFADTLSIASDGDDLAIFPAGGAANTSFFDIRVTQAARATKSWVHSTVFAVGEGFKTIDQFAVDFRFPVTPAHELIVREVTTELYGKAELDLRVPGLPLIDVASFLAGDPANVLEFTTATPSMRLRVFAAKWGTVERAYWLMLPWAHKASSLMIVISHTFGQNDRIYRGVDYSNPLSKALLDFVKDHFVTSRWGGQVAAARADMALLMPVRARSGTGGAGELGVFADHGGIGARIVTRIAALADAMAVLQDVGVVTYSNGISDANAFIHAGGSGLKFTRTINQDPAHGVAIASSPTRKQYLSGYTTGGPRPGFEYMPDERWVNDPRRAVQQAAWGRGYLHDWTLPQYTLALALST
jgi:hypothetical protein